MALTTFTAGTNAIAAEVNGNFTELRNQLLLTFDGMEQASISCTQAAASNTFATKKKFIMLHNSGSNKVYVDFEADATTSSFTLDSNERFELYGVVSKISAICDTGLTSTLKIIGLGDTTESTTLKVFSVACTQTNASQALTAGSKGLIIKNAGTNKVYLNIDAAATTNHYFIEPGAYLTIGKQSAATAQFICDTSKTSTIKIIEATEW